MVQDQELPYADTPAPGWLFQMPPLVRMPAGPPQDPPGNTILFETEGKGVLEGEAPFVRLAVALDVGLTVGVCVVVLLGV